MAWRGGDERKGRGYSERKTERVLLDFIDSSQNAQKQLIEIG